jgi:hypothetical protein
LPVCSSVDIRHDESQTRTADFFISNSKGVDMGDKGKKDKARREDQKKPKRTLKEKRER